uniref:DUF1725 domain-containing protein n=1 Tax=Macrostomum lignano TaxID=282301 RepID=A0A1I8FQU1_9PLAT
PRPPDSERRHHPIDRLARALSSVGLRHGYTRRLLDPRRSAMPPGRPGQGQPQRAGHAEPGCSGFAEKLINWPAEKLIGGASRDPDTGRLTSGRALLSALVLKSPEHLLREYRQNQPLNDWSLDKTKRLLDAWWEHFNKLVARRKNSRHGAAHLVGIQRAAVSQRGSRRGHRARSLDLSGDLLIAGCCPPTPWPSWLLPFVQLGIGTFYCLLMANCYNHLYQTSEPAQHHGRHPSADAAHAPQTLAFLLVCQAAAAGSLLTPWPPFAFFAGTGQQTDCSWPCCAWPACLPFWPADCARRRPSEPTWPWAAVSTIGCPMPEHASAALAGSHLGWNRRRLSACLLGGVAWLRLAELNRLQPGGAGCRPLPGVHASWLTGDCCNADSALQLRIGKIDYPRQQLLTSAAVPRPGRAAIRPIAAAAARSGWTSSGAWLLRLQSRFDEDVRLGAASARGSALQGGRPELHTRPPRTQGILAAHLLVQTGRFDEYDLT